MSFPTLSVTPGTGQVINTLPNSGQSTLVGSLPVVLDNSVETSPGTPGTNTISVQGNASGIPIPVYLASIPLPANASQDGIDGSGISPPSGGVGIRGWLSGIYNRLNGIATSSNQTTANITLTSILSALTSTLTVNNSGVTQPVSASSLPLPTGAATSANQTTSNTALSAIQTSLAGTISVSASSLPLASNAATAGNQTTGNTALAQLHTDITAIQPRSISANAQSVFVTNSLANNNDAASLLVDGMSTCIIQVASGAWSGTIAFEGSADNGSTWNALNMVLYAGSATVTSTTSGGLYEMACGGLTNVRARATSSITSGPVVVIVRATNGLKSVRVGAPTSNPVNVQNNPTTFVDRSGTTSATPGNFTAVASANSARQYLRVTNTSTQIIYLWDKTGSPTQASSIPLAVGAFKEFNNKVSSTAIQIMSQTASMSYEAAEG